jgi:hypothetical protein
LLLVRSTASILYFPRRNATLPSYQSDCSSRTVVHDHGWTRKADPLKARQEELRDRLQTQIEFVLTELDTSITFCDLALGSKDPMKTRRNVQNARTGYETALRFSQKVQPYLESNNQYHEKIAHVRALLRRLGEQV